MTDSLCWQRRSSTVYAIQYTFDNEQRLLEILGTGWRTVSGMETAGWVRLSDGWAEVPLGDFILLEPASELELMPVAVCDAGLFRCLYEPNGQY